MIRIATAVLVTVLAAPSLFAEARIPARNAATPTETVNWTAGLSYSYDGSGNITAIGEDRFAYDRVGRLTQAQVNDVTAPIHLIVNTSEVRLITIPGAVWEESDWDPLLRDADSIVAFFDLQHAREAEVIAARERIDGRTRLAVLTKSDLRSTYARNEAIE